MRSVTVFSLLALLVLIGGGTMTLLGGRAMLKDWARSGQELTIGETWEIELPEGPVLAYYQSPDVIPTGHITLHVTTIEGEPVPVRQPDDPNDFAVGGVQGRALFAIHPERKGVYLATCRDALGEPGTGAGDDQNADGVRCRRCRYADSGDRAVHWALDYDRSSIEALELPKRALR